jgi:hypothetical protein
MLLKNCENPHLSHPENDFYYLAHTVLDEDQPNEYEFRNLSL